MTSRWRSRLAAAALQFGVCCSSLLPPIVSRAAAPADVRLVIHPQVCTLSRHVQQCDIPIEAIWLSDRPESLCLIILQRRDIKQCWENYRSGTYTIELTFTHDLTFQLRDPKLQDVLASEVLRVIREAIQYRQRRRDVWDIFG